MSNYSDRNLEILVCQIIIRKPAHPLLTFDLASSKTQCNRKIYWNTISYVTK